MSNLDELINSNRFRMIEGTVIETKTVGALAAETDVIFHMAAAVEVDLIIVDPVGSIEINVTGTQVVLQAAMKNDCQILIGSSSEIYGKSKDVAFTSFELETTIMLVKRK